jgi:hypothetical protein
LFNGNERAEGAAASSVVKESGGGGVEGDAGVTGKEDMSRGVVFFVGSHVAGRVGDDEDDFVCRSEFTKETFSVECLY